MMPSSIRSLMIALMLGGASLLASAQQLTVSAAASLTNVLKDLGTRYEASHPGAKLQFNFAASGVLIQQIVQGAPVDVFISADDKTIHQGVEQKLFDPASIRNIASNQLVLIEPSTGGADLHALTDLSGAGVKHIAIGKPASVPAGRYAKEALDAAQSWASLEPKFVYAESVRQVLDYVARGETEAGFVYATDAAIMADKVMIVMNVGSHAPVHYPAAVLTEGKQKAAANDFIAFLLSAPAQEVLAKAGFSKP